MITKFKSINNLAVFQNYEWDTNVQDAAGNIVNFKDINIIYGRNYSGKTTLARIIRALENGEISDKYENPEFEVSFNDTTNASQTELTSHGKKVRVFNEDFVKENLRFIIYPDESITPFAILGGNASIEAEIESLKSELGDNKEDEETGFYLELKNASQVARTASESYQTENTQLTQKLSYKATNNPNGIKYKSERFGDQNYNIRKLEVDISNVIDSQFTPLTDEEVALKEKLIMESVNLDVQQITRQSIDIKTLSEKAETLVAKIIGNSNKIEQLVRDSILNRWVKEGRQLHKEKLDECSFCGNDITQERWNELDSHFDEESEKLEKDIDNLIIEIEGSIARIETQVPIDINKFYSKYHSKLNRLINFREYVKSKLAEELTSLKLNLQQRKQDLLNPIVFNKISDSSKRLEWCWSIFENIRLSANTYSNEIGAEQSEAKKLLRLREIYDFANTIQYKNEVLKISQLKARAVLESQNKKDIDDKITAQLKLIDDKGRLMNDEEKGALKVNEFLNNFFGHEFLTLKALEDEDQFGDKKIRFEIIRNGNKAHHLSEGECSLIAFCYFMAKLEDVETRGSKPIIWIDDPISSLDSNHIFFVYSLINSEIVSNQDYEQLFISTHNLDFLKYLKRFPSAANSVQRGYFIISRESEVSKIKLMPKYLKDYVTEFNFLFHQIYLCANAEADEESQHSLFYNFGNNTRKFLEAFLFYKYPNANNDDKLTRFFGDNNQASSMTDRINNEFSHLEGLFERSMTPIDVPEMKKTAIFILDKIKEKDNDQYEALLISIDAET